MRIKRTSRATAVIVKWRLALVVAALAFLGFSIYRTATSGGVQDALVSEVQGSGAMASNGASLVPDLGDLPFPDAVAVGSVAEAQARLSIELPVEPGLGQDWTATAIWILPKDRSENGFEQARISFGNGIDLGVAKNGKPDIRKIVAEEPTIFTLAQVGEHDAMVHERGSKLIRGRTWEEPSAVTWWQNGTTVTLYSFALPSAELLARASLFARPSAIETEPGDDRLGPPTPPSEPGT